jgi:hypothetical protein
MMTEALAVDLRHGLYLDDLGLNLKPAQERLGSIQGILVHPAGEGQK